jgi:hypothetical protein
MLHVSSAVGIDTPGNRRTRCEAPLVVVHTHPATPLMPIKYLVRELLPLWREMGIAAVEVPAPAFVPSARVALMHIDFTTPLPAYQRVASQYRRALNSHVGSIEKRVISRHLVTRGDGYDGPVIVKTNANYGGVIDYQTTRWSRPWITLASAARERLPWHCRARLRDKAYRIYNRVRDVPTPVWYNPDLVVERLLCERDGDMYVLRSWNFLGDRGFVGVNRATSPIVQATTIVKRTLEHEPPPEIQQLRKDLNFDFGKFDFTIVDGVPHLLDANCTTTVGRASTWANFAERIRWLAPAIEQLL